MNKLISSLLITAFTTAASAELPYPIDIAEDNIRLASSMAVTELELMVIMDDRFRIECTSEGENAIPNATAKTIVQEARKAFDSANEMFGVHASDGGTSTYNFIHTDKGSPYHTSLTLAREDESGEAYAFVLGRLDLRPSKDTDTDTDADISYSDIFDALYICNILEVTAD